jgi:FkbH-like protein
MDLASLPWLLPSPADFRQRLSAVGHDNAGSELWRLASTSLSIDQLLKIARKVSILRAQPDALKPLRPFRLGVLSNCTADFIAPAIEGSGPRHGLAIETAVPPYGQIVQAAADPASVLYARPLDAVLLSLDYHAFAFDGAGSIADAIDLVNAVRQNVARIAGVPCIVQTLPSPPHLLQGSLDTMIEDSARARITEFNARLIVGLRNTTDVLFDVQGLAEAVGLANWHDPVAWYSAKLPFALPLVPLYAEHVARLVGAMVGKTRKCLVLDLDNTVWGGVIGDDGLDGIKLAEGDAVGEIFRAVQKHALAMSQRGIVLAVASKNTEANARVPFQRHPDMILREEHIAVFRANWTDKATNLREIARALDIGTDALVFLDDNPAEREIVRREIPEVAVPELPADAAHYPWVLAAGGYFDAISLTEDDRNRAKFYRDRSARMALQENTTDVEGYLRSLDMTLSVSPFDRTGRARITQLINKSNQFNLTTRRYTEAAVAKLEADPSVLTLQARLSDRFGDNGMISVIICHRGGARWKVDTWLMSCRVLGRKVEHTLLNILADLAKQDGATSIEGTFIPTDRNELVHDHYAKLGFSCTGDHDGTTTWTRDIASFMPFNTPMAVSGAELFRHDTVAPSKDRHDHN